MKCPSCGVWNRNHYTVCFRCGTPLPKEDQEAPAENTGDDIAKKGPDSPSHADRDFDSGNAFEENSAVVFEDENGDIEDDPYENAYANPPSPQADADVEAEPPKKRRGLFSLFRREKAPKKKEAEWIAADDGTDLDESYEDGEGYVPPPEYIEEEPVSQTPPVQEIAEDEPEPEIEQSETPEIEVQEDPVTQDPERKIRFVPFFPDSTKPTQDLSDYAQNVNLYDYTNWDSDEEEGAAKAEIEEAPLAADEQPEAPAAAIPFPESAASDDALPYPAAEDMPPLPEDEAAENELPEEDDLAEDTDIEQEELIYPAPEFADAQKDSADGYDYIPYENFDDDEPVTGVAYREDGEDAAPHKRADDGQIGFDDLVALQDAAQAKDESAPEEALEDTSANEEQPPVPKEPSTKQNERSAPRGREVLIPAKAVSRDELLEHANSEISREIIQAINTTPPPAEADLSALQDPRPRRLMSLSRRAGATAPSMQARAAAQPPKERERPQPARAVPVARPEPAVVPLDKLAPSEEKPVVEKTEPFAFKDEIQVPKKQKGLVQSIDEVLLSRAAQNKEPAEQIAYTPLFRDDNEEPETVQKREDAPKVEPSIFATPMPTRPAEQEQPPRQPARRMQSVSRPQSDDDEPMTVAARRTEVDEFNLEPPAPEEAAQPDNLVPESEQPEWAKNALRELNLIDTPLERSSRQTKSGHSAEVLELSYQAAPRRTGFGINSAPVPPVSSVSVGTTDAADEQQAPRRRPSSMSAPRAGARDDNRRPAQRSAPSSYDTGRSSRPRSTEGASSSAGTRPSSYEGRRSSTPSSGAYTPQRRPGSTSSGERRIAAPQEQRAGNSQMRVHSSRSAVEDRPIQQVNIPVKRNARRIKNPVRLVIASVLVLAVLSLLIFGIVKGAQALISAFGNGEATPPPTQSADPAAPSGDKDYTVVPGDVNGQAGQIITFTGNDGDIVYITEPIQQNVIIAGGIGVLKIADSQLIGNQIVEEAVEVELKRILHESATGKETPLEPIKLTIAPPEANLEIIAPAGGREEVSLTDYQVKIRVDLGSTVTIGGVDVSDMISTQADNAGMLIHTVQVSPTGDNTIPIIVQAPGHKTNKQDIVLYRTPRAIAIELDSSTVTKTDEATVTIKGKVADGATVKVTSPIDGEVTQNSDGSFSFKAKLSRYGDNTITIVASKDGTDDVPFTHVVTYNPTADTYTKSAWRMEYDTLLEFEGKAFKCTGQIVDVLTENDPYTFTFNVGTAESPKLVVIEMVEDKRPEPGKKYSIYADVVGPAEDGLPKLIGRYYYDAT